MRSIPAGAGETREGMPAVDTDQVDPRGCGGDEWPTVIAENEAGRSPRVRGRLAWVTAVREIVGSIPAGAGETLFEKSPAER